MPITVDLLTLGAVFATLMLATVALGVYLLATNPPVDRRKFVGVGAEKRSDEDLRCDTE